MSLFQSLHKYLADELSKQFIKLLIQTFGSTLSSLCVDEDISHNLKANTENVVS